MPESRSCPALLISAPSSGQGKTTLTAALAYYHRRQGRRVSIFKVGPDFLDSMILEFASGQQVYQLDLWMCGEAECRRLLYEAAGRSDLILVEGVMGLFDGQPSSADLATLFGIPVLAVINATGMGGTFQAIAHGLSSYRAGLPFAGVIANGLAGASHAKKLSQADHMPVPFWGWLERKAELALPSRHLGLLPASEIKDLEFRLQSLADALCLTSAAGLPAPVEFWPAPVPASIEPVLSGKTIAVARDDSFCFLYAANLNLLQELGASLVFFSPLADEASPQANAVYLPGGYPELYLPVLAQNDVTRRWLQEHVQAGRALYAECGGMLYLLDWLEAVDGCRESMAGIMPGHACMQKRLEKLGHQEVDLGAGLLRGHTFHYSRAFVKAAPLACARHPQTGQEGEPVWRLGSLTASYLHLYFPCHPAAAAALFTRPENSGPVLPITSPDPDVIRSFPEL